MELFSSAGFDRADFAKMAIEGKLLFRHGTRSVLETCHDNGIELVVMSAGIYEYVESALQILTHSKEEGYSKKLADEFNPIIVSNRFSYELSDHPTKSLLERAEVVGYKLPLVTPMTKRETIYSDEGPVRIKKNVIVVGDIVEDAAMAKTRKHDTILKVGILVDANKDKHRESQMESFANTFDLITSRCKLRSLS